MLIIDLNCDIGEGCGNDAELMHYVSSTNIACGFHAGDATTMRETVDLAIANKVAIGAHPGYRDSENFGRRTMSLLPKVVFEIVVDQVAALKDICETRGANLHHVKPHGALYNQAATDKELAAAIAEAVATIDRDLIVYGLSGSFLISQANLAGLRTASEVFADRTYQADGTLTPRSQPHALIENANESVKQVLQMIEAKTVTATTGETIAISADTICIHGDGLHAVEFALKLRQKLAEKGIVVQAI